MAQLHPGLLAYCIVNTVRFQLKKNDCFEKKENLQPVSFQWKEIVRVMDTPKNGYYFGAE
jgi:hypothetical protein